MLEYENLDYATFESENIIVSVCPELLDSDDTKKELWGICLRIENNSDEKIILIKKELCVTDCNGITHFDTGYGFNGEIPDLESGEIFEYSDTMTISGKSAVLYGYCYALTPNNKEIKIKLPFMEIGNTANFANLQTYLH